MPSFMRCLAIVSGLLTLLALRPAWGEPRACQELRDGLRESGRLPMALPATLEIKHAAIQLISKSSQILIWNVREGDCLSALVDDLRLRADAGDAEAERWYALFILNPNSLLPPDIRDEAGWLALKTDAHRRLRRLADDGDAVAVWLTLGGLLFRPLPIRGCAGEQSWLPPLAEVLPWLEGRAEALDPELYLHLEFVALRGLCMAADPYRALAYRARWQALTGRDDELCDGDLAGCNRQLDYVWRRGPERRP